ncbi:MAG: hypothetical protein ACTSRH_12980 [Promethearchaeota archaeon]
MLFRDLGFDSLTFNILSDDIFIKLAKVNFKRHHLNRERKWFVYLKNLLLTDSKHHGSYSIFDRGILDFRDQGILLDIIQDLIYFKDSDPNYMLTLKDV